MVVLLTGDDVGALGSEPGTLRPRVRQNVIFELAFAIAKLTRERVCALYDEGSSMRRAYGSIPSRSGLFRASKVTPVVTAGQTYFIVVDGYGGSSGSLTLSVTPPLTGARRVCEGMVSRQEVFAP